MSLLCWYPGYDLPLKEIVRADNCHLYDSDGRKYVDLESGVWCTSIGHGNRRVLRALVDQSERISHTGFSYSSRVVEEAAGDLLSLLDFDGGRCVFLCSGSEAVEYGVRVAQQVSRRPLLLTMADSYFGAYGSAKQRREDEWFSFDWLAGDDWTTIPFDRIGGFVFEPGSSSGLVRFPPGELIRNIVDTVRRNRGLIVVNEVTTGIGRTGAWFGYQHYGVSPDIVALGKGIGNGYPVSATALTADVVARLGEKPVKYAQSHQNDPLGAVVAREVLRIVGEERLIDRSREIGNMLLEGLHAIASRKDRIRSVRGRGLMAAVELEDDAGAPFTQQTQRELLRRGFVVAQRPGLNVLRLDPALTIEQEDIAGFLAAFDDLLQ
jgi:acetylornithine aminotransferase